MSRLSILLGVAVFVAAGGGEIADAADRNCPALTSNAGEQSPFGFDPQLIEVQFCGARLIDAAELQRFQATYQLTFDHITPTGGQTNVIYIFRVQSGTPAQKVRQVALDVDVAAASVESLGQAALPSATPNGLPSTATGNGTSQTAELGSGANGSRWPALLVAVVVLISAGRFVRSRSQGL